MGVPPKPPSKRQRRNKRSDAGILSIRQGDTPEPSTAWQQTVKDEWESFWHSEAASLVLVSSDLAAVRRLFDYRAEHARSLALYRKCRVTKGSMGQERLSPALDAVVRLERLILPLEDRFGLSSMGRLRLGAELVGTQKSLAQMNAALDAEAEDDDDNDGGEIIDLPGPPAN